MNTTDSTLPHSKQPSRVEQFADWYLRNPQAIPTCVFAGVTFPGDFAQLTLYREGDLQVQLCLCRPNAFIPDHGHPNVDSIVVYLTGQIYFRLDGKPALEGVPAEDPDGTCSHNGRWLAVAPGQSHGADIGPLGGAFMTFQHWISGKPTSVENDWDGPPLTK